MSDKQRSLNAVKHGLTGSTILLPADEVESYQKSVALTFDRYKPVTDAEKQIIQFVADHEWKLARSLVMDSAILARGRNVCTETLNKEEGTPSGGRSLYLDRPTRSPIFTSRRLEGTASSYFRSTRTKHISR